MIQGYIIMALKATKSERSKVSICEASKDFSRVKTCLRKEYMISSGVFSDRTVIFTLMMDRTVGEKKQTQWMDT